MSEQRLIDANALREDWLENGENEYVYDTNSFLCSLDDAPTISPEFMPIVRHLREELERVTAERDAIKRDIEEAMKISELECPGFLCGFCAKNPYCVKCNGPEWRGVQKEE